MGARVHNMHMDPRLQDDNELCWRKISKAITAACANNVAKLQHSSGGDRCLFFHIKGFCHNLCSRGYDHKILPAAEKDVFYNWCKESYA